MQQQRTVVAQRNGGAGSGGGNGGGVVTVAAFGAKHQTTPGKTVAETLTEMGLTPQPYQSVRVNAEEVADLKTRQLAAGETVTLTNRIAAGNTEGDPVRDRP